MGLDEASLTTLPDGLRREAGELREARDRELQEQLIHEQRMMQNQAMAHNPLVRGFNDQIGLDDATTKLEKR